MTESEVLSAKNPQLKRLRRLVNSARERRSEDVLVIEGPTLVVEALASRLSVDALFAEVSVALPPELDRQSVTRVADGVLAAVLSTVSPQPVAAIVARPRWAWADLAPDRPVLVLVDVRDPGNLGSLWRSAEAAGNAGIVLVGHPVDPTNPKVVRAAAGAAFRHPLVVATDFDEAVAELHRAGRTVFATVLDADCPAIDEVDLRQAAVALGNEAHGLDDATIAACDGRVHIPMAGPTESLGVAAAGAVVAFEAARQARTNPANHLPTPSH